MKPYLHIGYHKTGSTFLQEKIFPALPMNQVMMPNVRYVGESDLYDPATFQQQLQTEYDLTQHPKTIISQETLSGRGDGNPYWDSFRIAQRLQATFPQGKVIIVIRNQYDYILSLYAFRVVIRGLERHTLSHYLNEKFDWLSQKLQYDRLIHHYHTLFGSENVLVMLYEQLAREPDVFLKIILDFMEVQTKINYSRERVNKSTRTTAIIRANRLINTPLDCTIEFLQTHNRLSQKTYLNWSNKFYGIKRVFVNPLLHQLLRSDQKMTFDKRWQAHFNPIFQASNQRLTQITSLPLAKYGYAL